MTALSITGIGPTIDDSTGAFVLGAGGMGAANGGRSKYSSVPIGSVAYGSMGTNTSTVAGTAYIAELNIARNISLTGAAILNGATVGTDKWIYALYNSAGAIVANTAVAGVLTAGANAFQQIAFTAPYAAASGRYFLVLQPNGTTDTFRSIAVSTFIDVLGSSATGTFASLPPTITVPTTLTADKAPIGYVY